MAVKLIRYFDTCLLNWSDERIHRIFLTSTNNNLFSSIGRNWVFFCLFVCFQSIRVCINLHVHVSIAIKIWYQNNVRNSKSPNHESDMNVKASTDSQHTSQMLRTSFGSGLFKWIWRKIYLFSINENGRGREVLREADKIVEKEKRRKSKKRKKKQKKQINEKD